MSKDEPYAVPGDDVTLTLLWHDGSNDGDASNAGGAGGAAPARKLHIRWLAGCINPPGDFYSGCYPQFAEGLNNPNFQTQEDTPTFTLHIPTEIDGRSVLHPGQDPRLPNYGLSYVFFAICAGNIVAGDEHFPVHCRDDQGRDMGPDDFIVGYSAIYFFEPKPDGTHYLNANPVANGLNFGGDDVTQAPGTCSDEAGLSTQSCLGACKADATGTGCVNPAPAAVDCEANPSLCIPACPEDGDPQKCPEHHVELAIDPRTFEQDEVNNFAYGNDYAEQMWIDYYSTAGRFKAATKLLNDATTGFNGANGTEFYAPKDAGPVVVWVVMHDNRGGVSWVGTTLQIQ